MKCKIITIGLCPCWDATYIVDGIDWGEHKQISSVTLVPAGKAMNVSKALAWMNAASVAAGLWGSEDIQQACSIIPKKILARFTPAPGRTRQNVTVVDIKHGREMHLRSPSGLATAATLKKLKRDLDNIVTPGSICVFAGSMPGQYLKEVIQLIKQCISLGAKIVIDTSGPAFKSTLQVGQLEIIKPNLEELSEVLGEKIRNESSAVAAAAKKLLPQCRMVLVSRGEKGAMLVTDREIIEAHCTQKRKAVNTVACGDFQVAGFLKEYAAGNGNVKAMITAVKSATARAWGWDSLAWSGVEKKIKVSVKQSIINGI